MFSLLLLLAQVSAVMACAATVPPGGYRPGQRRPKPHEIVETIVVSNHNYNQTTNSDYLKVFRSKFNAYVRGRGMGNGYGLSEESVVDVKGKFGVKYDFIGVKCDQVKEILVDMKRATDFIDHINMKCHGRPEFDAY